MARYEATDPVARHGLDHQLAELSDGREVKLCGIITTVKAMLTKKGDRMAYLTLEDLHGMVEVIVFPDLYKTAADLIVPETAGAHHGHGGPGRKRHEDSREQDRTAGRGAERRPSSESAFD